MKPLPLGDFDDDDARRVSEYLERQLERLVVDQDVECLIETTAERMIRDVEGHLADREGDGE